MKKLLFLLVCLFSFFSFSFADITITQDYSYSISVPAKDNGGGINSALGSCDYDQWYNYNSVSYPYNILISSNTPFIIGKYVLGQSNLQNWTFDASNDGSSWTTLQTVVTGSSDQYYTCNLYSYFPSYSSISYKYYRFHITASNNYPAIDLLKIYPVIAGSISFTSMVLNSSCGTISCINTGSYTTIFYGNYDKTSTSLFDSYYQYTSCTPPYTGNTGVYIHRKSNQNGGTWTDFYTLSDLYLGGAFDKTYTGGTSNFRVLTANPYYASTGSAFSGYQFTGRNNIQTGVQIFSGNVFEGFYSQGMKFIISNYPVVLIAMFGIMLVLLLFRVLFRKRI